MNKHKLLSTFDNGIPRLTYEENAYIAELIKEDIDYCDEFPEPSVSMLFFAIVGILTLIGLSTLPWML